MKTTDAIRTWWMSFAPSLDVENLIPRALQSALAVTNGHYGVVLLKEQDSGDFVVHTVKGLPEVVALHRLEAEALAPVTQIDEPILMPSLPQRSSIRLAVERANERLTRSIETSAPPRVYLVVPLRIRGETLGLLIVGMLGPGPGHRAADLGFISGLAGQIQSSFGNATVHERTLISFHHVIETFAECIDARGPHSRGHSRSVSYYAGLIGEQMGLPVAELECLELAGYLHDLGEVFVPETVLKKRSQLTKEELAQVHASVGLGADLLQAIPGMEQVAVLVRHQGECWDGSGYPSGLAGEGIPLGARVLAAASRFTAMLSNRQYRKAMTVVSGAMSELGKQSGKTLDPTVVQALLSAMGHPQ